MKCVVLVALHDELINLEKINVQVFYTGVGKINAAYWTTKVILQERPDFVLNVGTAGALRPELYGKAHDVKSVIERDITAEPLAPRGSVLFDNSPNEIFIGDKGIKVGTGDSFVTREDDWLSENNIDLVDMELFAIAKSSLRLGTPCYSIKSASDFAGKDADKQWASSRNEARLVFNFAVEQKLEGIVSDLR